ncbi:MAG TPA: ABC transporter permease [Gemmatimonadaceae bacterium]|nr:ABC transporter permease [Gemmatimonadaceae bacterium]
MKRPGIRRLFSLALRRRDWEREVEEEILTHLAIRAERLVEIGMSPAEAKDEAVRRFGPLGEARARLMEAAGHREEHMRRREILGELRQDAAFAWRTLARNRGWAAVAIITLALGIGATTAVWSAATTLLLRPLSYPDAGRVVNVSLLPTTGNSTGVDVVITPEAKVIRAWREAARGFDAIEPYMSSSWTLGTGADAEEVVATRVLPSFMSFAGEAPLRGRNFTERDISARAPVALIGEGTWRTRFASDPAIIGKSILLNGTSRQVIGVAPVALKTPRIGSRPTAFWIPLDLSDDKEGYRVIARLQRGVPQEVAARELDTITSRIGVFGAGTEPFRTVLTSPGRTVSFRDSLVMLTGAVLLVLLVAAGNVAHLLLARAVTRQREVAIRTALGASRGRLVRQLMTETFLLSAIGCALGAFLGHAALKTLVKFRPATLPELALAHIDAAALGLVIAASLACALAFGAATAIATSSRESAAALRSGIVAVFSRGGERFRSGLVVTEIALSAMLLVGAALLVRTVIEMQRTDLGFDPRHLHVIIPEIPRDRHPTPAARIAAVHDLATAMKGIPGVEDATVSDALPSMRNFSLGTLQVEGRPLPGQKSTSFIDVGEISPSYFRVLGARLVEGRMFADSGAGPSEIIVNEGFARRTWKPGEAIGKRMRIAFGSEDNPWMTVVGVVRDVSTMGPVGDKAAPFLYMPLRNAGSPGIIYRTRGDAATPAQVLSLARSRMPGVRVRQQEAEKVIDATLGPPRFIMLLMAGFTVLAVILAAVGLYGTMAYAVAQRSREIGIRIALGATRETIARSVVGRALLLGVFGAGSGLLLAVWGTRVLERSLYGVSRLDPASFIAGGAVLIFVAVAASLVPMRRAVAVDPMTAIRAD